MYEEKEEKPIKPLTPPPDPPDLGLRDREEKGAPPPKQKKDGKR